MLGEPRVGARFLENEATVLVTEAKFKRHDIRAAIDDAWIFDSSSLHRKYPQPSTSIDKDDLKIDSRDGPIKHRGVWLGFNGGIRSVIVDQSIAYSRTEVVRFDDMFRG
jgi:hypothetical protein